MNIAIVSYRTKDSLTSLKQNIDCFLMRMTKLTRATRDVTETAIGKISFYSIRDNINAVRGRRYDMVFVDETVTQEEIEQLKLCITSDKCKDVLKLDDNMIKMLGGLINE